MVWLLGDNLLAVQAVLPLCEKGVLEVETLNGRAPAWISAFMGRYRNVRPDLADAALVYLAEREDITTIFTLDRRDFSTYRRQDGSPFAHLPE